MAKSWSIDVSNRLEVLSRHGVTGNYAYDVIGYITHKTLMSSIKDRYLLLENPILEMINVSSRNFLANNDKILNTLKKIRKDNLMEALYIADTDRSLLEYIGYQNPNYLYKITFEDTIMTIEKDITIHEFRLSEAESQITGDMWERIYNHKYLITLDEGDINGLSNTN